MKIVSVVGARPQFIKAAAVSRALRSSLRIQEFLVHTGQHYDDNMSKVFFEELEIPRPNVNLGIGSSLQGAQTGQMLAKIEETLVEQKPDWVLVYGDTNSTLAGALASAKLHIPVAHVEAGLRSFNKKMPEEINRVLTDHVSDLLLAPTETAVENLAREGVESQNVHWVGDVMYDVALYYAPKSDAKSEILKRLNLSPKKFVLATIHRAENTDNLDRLRSIFEAFSIISKEIPIVLPLHPRTRAVLARQRWHYESPSFQVVDPVGYLDMVKLTKSATLVVTDSGGLQKEAFFHHVPCVTLRDETEWVELVNLGWNVLVSPNSPDGIVGMVLSDLRNLRSAERREASPYGEGRAAEKCADVLLGAVAPV